MREIPSETEQMLSGMTFQNVIEAPSITFYENDFIIIGHTLMSNITLNISWTTNSKYQTPIMLKPETEKRHRVADIDLEAQAD